MIQVKIGNVTRLVKDLSEISSELTAAYVRGEKPEISQVQDVSGVEKPEEGKVYSIFGAPKPKGYSEDWGKVKVTDDDAKKRIEAQHAALRASGLTVNEKAQVAENGTRMMKLGYDNQAARKAEHDQKMSLQEVAHEIDRLVRSENRRDVEMSARDFAQALDVNGKITVNGKALTEQAIRGLAGRLESPMLGYVLGMRSRMTGNVGKPSFQADKAMLAEILKHECRHNPDAKLKLRTRNGGVDDVFAIVSPQYAPADATMVIPELMRALPSDARGSFSYDPKSTQWEIRANVWTPTPVEEQAIGEAFEGYASFRARDNGTSRIWGGGGAIMLACWNAGTYSAEQQEEASRIHRGRPVWQFEKMVAKATASIHVLCKAWGTAREAVIPMTAEEKAQGDKFLSDLFVGLLSQKPLAAVLPGRKADHASGLVAAYHAERRNRDELVRADFAQAWTRYIQTQTADVRRDAESAIGSWVVSQAHQVAA